MTYWEKISRIEAKQTAKGLKEYGQMLEQNTAPALKDRIEYYQEELVDALKYSCWIVDAIDKVEADAYFKGIKAGVDKMLKRIRLADEIAVVDLEIIEKIASGILDEIGDGNGEML